MKTLLLTLFGICVLTQLQAQQSEFSVQVNSGLFHYSGSSAAFTSVIVENGQTDKTNFTTDPYGHKNGFSYGAALQEQYISKSGFILGLQGGYQVLRSKVDINFVQPESYLLDGDITGPYNINTPSKGQTYLMARSVNLSPYLGYRLTIEKVKLDLMPGLDIDFNLSRYDKGKATTTTDPATTYQTNFKLTKAPTDVRIKLGAAAYYGRFGITAAYAHGLNNLTPKSLDYTGVITKAHSELFSFGVSYRLVN